ncbi:hypothetical protein WS91_28270 [Burkholderia sp. MSMB1498]|nr:hypothetical protein WS91_28270 [Burkholderia sp. MSMB1498]
MRRTAEAISRAAYGIRRASSIRARGVRRVACRVWHVACVAACRFVRPRPDRSRAGEPRRAWVQSAPCAMRARLIVVVVTIRTT